MKLDQIVELFWDTPSWLSARVSVFLSLARGSELSGSDVYLHIVKNDLDFFLQIQPGYVLWDGLTWNFSGFFFLFLGWYVGKIIYREYIVI